MLVGTGRAGARKPRELTRRRTRKHALTRGKENATALVLVVLTAFLTATAAGIVIGSGRAFCVDGELSQERIYLI